MIKDDQRYRIITDQVGSVRLVVNAIDGTIAQRIDYTAFGQVLEDTSPGFQPFAFAGGIYDADTGLVRFGARDYDPVTGRWTAKDPILFNGRQAILYVYAFNDPVQFTDPSGQIVPLVAGGIVLGSAAVLLKDDPTLGDFAFGAATGAISGVALVAGSPLLAAVGAGFGLTVTTDGFQDVGGFADAGAGFIGGQICDKSGGPAGPFVSLFCEEALSETVNECRE